jgi:hypothetical protein
MVKGGRVDRRGSGLVFWVLLLVVILGLYSISVAILTQDDCGEGVAKTWSVFPPEWECDPQLPGYG